MMYGWMLLTYVSLLVLRIGSADAQVSADPTPSTICGLDGFQLDTLEQPAYWSVTLHSGLCVVPKGYGEVNITSCTVYFSVCKTLPGGKCGGVTNSSTCQEVTTNDDQTYYYSIGDYHGNAGYEATGGDSVGFLTMRERDNLYTRLCNGTFETTLTWTCDSTKVWDSTSQNVTRFMQTATKGLNDCYLQLEFLYNGACYEAPTLTPDYCQLQPYNVVPLTLEDYWFATVSNEACYSNRGNAVMNCKIFVAFCQPVPLSIDPACYGASVCQVGTDFEGVPVAYSMGQFKDSTRFYQNDEGITGGFHMDVSNGSRPDDGRCNNDGIKTRVILSCNSTTKWPPENQDLSSLIQVAYIGALDPCEYTIYVQYSGACNTVGDVPSPVGWILMGIFFFVVIVYFTVGACYQYFVRGARGPEVIPNYEFWSAFTMFVLEGCKFSLDIITCFQFGGTIKNPLKAPGTSGIDYDKI